MNIEDEEEIQRLYATNAATTPIDEQHVLRPKSVQTDKEFQDFLTTKSCPVCLQVPRYPVAIGKENCGHDGCESCLSRLEVCPVGRCGPYGVDELVPFKRWPLRAKVSFNQDLLVKCGNCDTFKEGTVERLVKHELRECPNRTVGCPGKLCEVQGKPAEIAKHYMTCHKGSDLDGINVTMQHVSRWDRKRRAERLRELEGEVASVVNGGVFGPAAAPRLVRTYRRGDMDSMNRVMRSNVFDL
jgi:hypothetical protein